MNYPYDDTGEWETVWVAEKVVHDEPYNSVMGVAIPGRGTGTWYASATWADLRTYNYNTNTHVQIGVGRIWKIKLPKNKLFHVVHWDPKSEYPVNQGAKWVKINILNPELFFDLIQDIKEQVNKVYLSQIEMKKQNKQRAEVVLLVGPEDNR